MEVGHKTPTSLTKTTYKMKYTNIRYSTTLNDAQTDYLADECQDINRMKCFKSFLRMAVLEPTKVSKKHFSAVLQPGQFMASKVELSMIWGCNRKTATRIIKEFNLMGILESVPSNRTTIHTLKCLSVWFTNQGMVKNNFFVSNPIVRPVVKPIRNGSHVPPESEVKPVLTEQAKPQVSGETSTVGHDADEFSKPNGQLPNSATNDQTEQNLTPSSSLPSDNIIGTGADGSSSPDGSDHSLAKSVTKPSTGFDDSGQTKPKPSGLNPDVIKAGNDQSPHGQCEASLQECVTKGKEKMP